MGRRPSGMERTGLGSAGADRGVGEYEGHAPLYPKMSSF